MIYEKRWLGSSTYWVKDKKFDTMEEALAHIGLDYRNLRLHHPWGHVVVKSKSLVDLQIGIREIEKYLRDEVKVLAATCYQSRNVEYNSSDESYTSALFRCNSLQDLAHELGMSLCGHYLVCGKIKVLLPRVDVATFTEGWEMIDSMYKESKSTRQNEINEINLFLKGLHTEGVKGP